MANPGRKKGKGHKGTRSAKNARSGKYIRQRQRTEINRVKKRESHKLRHPNDLTIM